MQEPIADPIFGSMTNRSPPAEKIACFRSLFRGRTDVYPRRFESRKSGKVGYQPACGNEWVRGICEKPRIKCSACPHQNWLPVNDETVRWHLEGSDAKGQPFVMGVYPMLLDETCFFLAMDLDGGGWAEDAAACAETCRFLKIPFALERSRSGDGAHLWFFFREAIPAVLARKLGSHILTETMERRPEIGLCSYDRFFPNQDTLPRGGFGNLIALPLQKLPRDSGNSLFLNHNLEPAPDQWALLGGVERLDRETVDACVTQAERRGRIVGVRAVATDEFALSPWEAPPSRTPKDPPIRSPLPKSLRLVLADQIYIPKNDLPPELRNRLIRIAAFQNPEFYRAQSMRLPTYDKPRVIACAEDYPEHLALPRGCREDVLALLGRVGVAATIDDRRENGTPITTQFLGQLRPDQQAAADAVLAHETGVLAATTAFGKTVLAAWLIAARGTNTLVLVHRQQLMEQWKERLSSFLDIQKDEIGTLGGGSKRLKGKIDVALIQSLVRKSAVDDRVAGYGQLIVDECHHLPATSFELVARRSKSKYVLGLSATVARKDGHHPIIIMQCGPIRYRVDAKHQAAVRPFAHNVIVRPTGFQPGEEAKDDSRMEYQRLIEALASDGPRNSLICTDVLAVVAEGRFPLVLTERTEHLEALVSLLGEALEGQDVAVIALRGGMGKRQLAAAMSRLDVPEGAVPRVVVATGRFVGEGFDDPSLDTLFLAMPVSWRGTIAQYVGRLHRLHHGKQEVRVYDYADLNARILSRMFEKRCAGYEAVGYTILLPAHALPGWPAEVPLPVSTGWKRDYAASVRRLIRDGIDAELATSFLLSTNELETPRSDGARSATEAFLYRRLQTLPATSGRFRMNAELPILFGQRSTMEVDFLCTPSMLAIEIDGPQHLGDAEAWRRDRRKDLLLQQHGYLVLRFLADDVGKRLDAVIDTILAAMRSGETRTRT